jgi:hypothetical protein
MITSGIRLSRHQLSELLRLDLGFLLRVAPSGVNHPDAGNLRAVLSGQATSDL